MPIGAFNGASPAGPAMLIIGVAVAVVCVVILVHLYRPKHLDERTGVDDGTAAGGSTSGNWGFAGLLSTRMALPSWTRHVG